MELIFGMPVIGRLQLKRSGHALNTKLARAVLADPKNYDVVEPNFGTSKSRVSEENPFAVFEPVESIA